ncbi:MAG TPA: glutathione S-transferase [Parvularcula sp.]|nr:glutathione S-transferase [Parvularcula sp.]
MTNTLYIGDKNYSSWSLRPWLVLRWAGVPFDERLIRLDQPGYGAGKIAEALAVSPTGRVPCLDADGLRIWDSLAIAEWAAETYPAAQLWPADKAKRAEARAVTAEMHSGFQNVRRDLSMNIRRRLERAPDLPPETHAEIARLDQIWSGLRARFSGEGPWLFGARSIADAFYAPVATRMRSYKVALGASASRWCETIFADRDFRAWEEGAIPIAGM